MLSEQQTGGTIQKGMVSPLCPWNSAPQSLMLGWILRLPAQLWTHPQRFQLSLQVMARLEESFTILPSAHC